MMNKYVSVHLLKISLDKMKMKTHPQKI